MKSESHQAPLGMTPASTLVNSGGFIMMNVANMKRVSPLIDFQLCLENMIIQGSKGRRCLDHMANGALM